MGVIDIVFLAAGDGDPLHYECRDCGANLDSDTDACPECGGGVAVYEL